MADLLGCRLGCSDQLNARFVEALLPRLSHFLGLVRLRVERSAVRARIAQGFAAGPCTRRAPALFIRLLFARIAALDCLQEANTSP